MLTNKLKDFLDREQVRYTTITHSRAYTAQEIAAITHTPGQELAKTVVVKINADMAMAVLPAKYQVDLARLKREAGAKEVTLAEEAEFRGRFPDCETGAMPPFGNLYGMPVFVDEKLAEDQEIAFNAGSHNELVRLAYEDFRRLANPTMVKLAAPAS